VAEKLLACNLRKFFECRQIPTNVKTLSHLQSKTKILYRLFYADFHPRSGKRVGPGMILTENRNMYKTEIKLYARFFMSAIFHQT